jgi:hypothetical protein
MVSMGVILSLNDTTRLDLGCGLDGALSGVGAPQTGHECWSSVLDESVAAAHSECHDGLYCGCDK